MAKKSTARAPRPAAIRASAPLPHPDPLGGPEASDDGGDMHEPMHPGFHDTQEADLRGFGPAHSDMHDDEAFAADWQPPAKLDAPEPRPNMTQRWIRMSLKGQNDPQNIAAQNGQGWRPRGLDTVPEGERHRYPATRDSRSQGMFLVSGDLVLCEMPTARFEQMRRHYRAKSHSQTQALVDDHLGKSEIQGAKAAGFGRPHVAERESRVNTSRVPIVAAD